MTQSTERPIEAKEDQGESGAARADIAATMWEDKHVGGPEQKDTPSYSVSHFCS